MTTDPLAWVPAEMDAAEKVARAVEDGSAPWDGRWEADGPDCLRTYNGHVLAYGHRTTDGRNLPIPLKPGLVDHWVRHDPAAVLRRIKADRKQLAEHAAVPNHGRYSERDCVASGCDGDHSEPPVCRSCRGYAGDPIEAPCRTVEILAEGWGWTPDA